MAHNFYPVILAGGSGTRFWPRSRRTQAKQVLALDGDRTMIQQTVQRLVALAPTDQFWVVTNDHLLDVIQLQLDEIPESQVIAEPAARNTAPAIGLAAFLLKKMYPDENPVLGLFPSDHVIADEKRFQAAVLRAIEIADAGDNIVVMGVPPSRPETGYGYIEAGPALPDQANVQRVLRFIEKPNLEKASQFVAAGNYYWNGGMFVWSAGTLVRALQQYLPRTAALLEQIAAAYGTPEFDQRMAELYPQCENISIDYAVVEPRSAEPQSNIFSVRADFGWNDLGSWTALYEHRAARFEKEHPGSNVIEAAGHFELNADGNYVYAPNKFVATIGVKDIVVVETEDAILVTTREHAQDVGKVVKYLAEKEMHALV
ncbi:MAG TPA: mannose-1-phosphate guanylyltransferase [Terriglobales bacterium]|jgi:mannose-1-phosphate guanylyltransferase